MDVQAVIMSSNLVAARFIQLATLVYTGGTARQRSDRSDRPRKPVEWTR